MNNTANLEHTGEFIDYKEVNYGIKSKWALETPINEKIKSWEDEDDASWGEETKDDASWGEETKDDASWEDIIDEDEVSLKDLDEAEFIELWESCDYRCEVCDEDQCFCEDGYKRKIEHQFHCKACQSLNESALFIGE